MGNFTLFDDADTNVKKQVELLWNELIDKKRIDHPEVSSQKVNRWVDIDTIKHRNVKEIGAEWIGYHALKQLGITDFLQKALMTFQLQITETARRF